MILGNLVPNLNLFLVIDLDKQTRNRISVGFNEIIFHTILFTNNESVHAFVKFKNVRALGQRSFVQHRFHQPKVQNLRLRTTSIFILTCHNYGKLGHIRLRCHKPMIRNYKQDLIFQIKFLTIQVSHLIKMMTQLTKIASSSKKIWDKKSEFLVEGNVVNCNVALR